MVLFAFDQGSATLVAAGIAAVASVLTLIPVLREELAKRKRKRLLVKLLAEPQPPIRSLEWLARRTGLSRDAVAGMLPDIDAHGVLMGDGKEGAALDSRHSGS